MLSVPFLINKAEARRALNTLQVVIGRQRAKYFEAVVCK